jgi:hypothetical protein
VKYDSENNLFFIAVMNNKDQPVETAIALKDQEVFKFPVEEKLFGILPAWLYNKCVLMGIHDVEIYFAILKDRWIVFCRHIRDKNLDRSNDLENDFNEWALREYNEIMDNFKDRLISGNRFVDGMEVKYRFDQMTCTALTYRNFHGEGFHAGQEYTMYCDHGRLPIKLK